MTNITIGLDVLEALAATGAHEISPGITLLAGIDFPEGLVGNRRVLEISAGFGLIAVVAADGTLWYWSASNDKWTQLPALPGRDLPGRDLPSPGRNHLP